MINHDDGEREASYAEKDGKSLAAAKKFGWKVISIKKDWAQVFNYSPSITSASGIE